MNSNGLYDHISSHLAADFKARRDQYVCLGIFAILMYVLSAGMWHPTPDSVLYINQARNLIQGEGLASGLAPNWVASPGYALLISPFFLFSDLPLKALTLFHTLLIGFYMLGVYAWASHYTTRTALFIAGAATLHTCIWLYCLPTTSETAFMTSIIWSVVCFTFWIEHRQSNMGRQAFLLAVILMCCGTLIRPAGLMIALGGTIPMWFNDRHNGRHWGRTLLACILWLGLPALIIVGFLTHESITSNNGLIHVTYLNGLLPEQSQNLQQMLLSGIHKRISDTGRLMIPGMFKAYSQQNVWLHVTMFVYIPVFIAAAWAWVKLLKQRSDALLWGLIPYLLLHITYSRFNDGARFMTPMLPVFMLIVWRLLGRLRSHQHEAMLAVFVLHSLVTIGLAIREQPRLIKTQQQWSVAETCAELIEQDPARCKVWMI